MGCRQRMSKRKSFVSLVPHTNGTAVLQCHYQVKISDLRPVQNHTDNMGVIKVIAGHLDALIGPGVMLLYPLYASIRAIESPSSLDDQQWLTYWVLYSLITLFELSTWKVLQWFPLWPYMKLVVCLWLVLPTFNGAAYIYENYVRKYVQIGTFVNTSYPEEQRRVLQMMSLDARKSVERYIEKHGLDAFERVVKAAEKEAKKH
ncbi:uncharacterized protein A4U43_C05F9930 [Asparagus officinalis]|uniref:HVA22-like protein n=2 Tax=Asparagus officinalis TaxID=4686 RepID=A0A5P1ER63_ASPOF|nr:uncharacterized protein A4U43_C05F9930 [Asparagus officinalis]